MHLRLASRRKILLGLGTTGGAVLLAGCETNPISQVLSNMGAQLSSGLKTLTGGNKHPYREQRNSNLMRQRALDLYQSFGRGTLVAEHLKNWQQAMADDEAAEVEFRLALEQEKIQDLPDLLPYMERGFIPMLRHGYNTLVMEEQAKKRQRQVVRRLNSTTYALPPGTGIKLQYRGYCMDPRKPAPARGELLELQYIDQRVPERIRPVFKGLCKWLGETDDPSGQALTWIVLSAGDENGHCKYMNQEQYNKLQTVYPNGGEIVKNYHNANVMGKALLTKGLEKISPHLARIDTRNPRQFDRAVDNELGQLIEAGLREQGAGLPGFTLLGPDLATRSVGAQVLTADSAIVNASGNTIEVDVSELEQTPRRHRQSISGIAGKSTPTWMITDHQKLSRQQEAEIQAAVAKAKERQKAWTGLVALAVTKGAEVGSILTNWKADQWIRAGLENKGAWMKLVSAGATYLPVVGNALSLYEALYGRNWLTNESLSTGDRVSAIIGSIPGAQVFKSVAKMNKIDVTSQSMTGMFSLAKAADSRIGKILDTPQAGYFKDVAGWVAGSTSVVPDFQVGMSNWMERMWTPSVNEFVAASKK